VTTASNSHKEILFTFCCPSFQVSENGEKGVNAKENGRLAAEFFFKAECAIQNGAPFTWFFVRPPWAPSGVCCKSCVFNSMVELCSDSEVIAVFCE